MKDQRFRGRVPPLYPLTCAQGRADLSAVGQQRDPLAPPAGRRRRFHFRSIRFGAAAIAASVGGATRSGRLGGAAAAGRRSPSGRRWSSGARGERRRRATGSSPTGGIERSAVSRSVGLTGSESSCARRAGRSDRPARAGWAALRQFRFSDLLWGERWSSGVRGERVLLAAAAAPGARRVFQLRGHRQPAALKDQRYRAALVLLAPNPRARGALGDQTDPLEPAGRRFANFVLAIFFGANDGARAFGVNAGGGRRGAGRAQGFSATGSSPTRGIERSAVSRSVGLTGSESSCARRAGRSDRPARAGWAALRQFRFSDLLWGERWSSGVRGER